MVDIVVIPMGLQSPYLSLEEYANLTDDIEMKLDEADRQAAMTEERLSHETVFSNVRSTIHGK